MDPSTPLQSTEAVPRRRGTAWVAGSLVLGLAIVLAYLFTRPTADSASPALAVPPAVAASHAAVAAPMPAEWATLSPIQRQALKPLAAAWSTLHPQQKQKWIALSRNYARMSPADQRLLHSRMVEWAALTPAQRSQARLNFAVAKKLPSQDKSEKWEAYQALSPEEKQKLADSANAVKSGGATAVRPVASEKLTALPSPRAAASTAEQESAVRQPKINTSPDQVDPETLLPQLP